ncbi:hypothetical protein [Leptolinea tardivitalis]|uniref:Uncharacterized protein n=1 Tax=Leptolinea tardivitalis TaxID=229920 RepID=A0A0P6WZR1_9CHLR|nr:hypothetical protein [Leptolinea tardivitalis]KPL74053.1 hypothetical protein ADM99_02130 [Leptolinea tardivitalis]
MDDVRRYRVLIPGELRAADIDAFCVPGYQIKPEDGGNTGLYFQTDQAGMIGLIRHLHGIGLVLLSIEILSQEN